jgi:hypothetical protein
MSRRSVIFTAAVIAALVLTPLVYSQQNMTPEGTNFLARANLGFDLFSVGFAFGAGAGYRFPAGNGTSEVLIDIYWSPPFEEEWEEPSDNEEGWEKNELLIISARVDWLFLYKPGMSGFFPVVGAGLFAGAFWQEGEYWAYGGSPPGTTYGGDYFASGSVFSVGAAYAFKDRYEARFEIPVLVFFGAYGRAAAVAIPFTASFLFKF